MSIKNYTIRKWIVIWFSLLFFYRNNLRIWKPPSSSALIMEKLYNIFSWIWFEKLSVWVKKKSTFLKNFPHSTGISSNCNFLQFIWGWKRISLSFTNFRALWTLLERGPTDWQNWFASLISWASELAKVLKREREK